MFYIVFYVVFIGFQNAKKSTRLSFRKKPKNKHKVLQAILYISGDSLRVIEDKAGITQDDGQVLPNDLDL